MTSTKIIDKLDKYKFHDMVIESVGFNNDKDVQLIVNALPYNTETNDYGKLKMIFAQIMELKMGEIILDKGSEIELTTFDYEYSGYFNCKLIFLLGVGRPSFTIDLKCDHIELEEGQ